MKKLLSLLLALALVMSCAAALAEDYYPAEKVSYNVWIRMRPSPRLTGRRKSCLH